jgi:hypothetical protein
MLRIVATDNGAIFCITATPKQHEKAGNNDQVDKCKSFNEISIIQIVSKRSKYFKRFFFDKQTYLLSSVKQSKRDNCSQIIKKKLKVLEKQ